MSRRRLATGAGAVSEPKSGGGDASPAAQAWLLRRAATAALQLTGSRARFRLQLPLPPAHSQFGNAEPTYPRSRARGHQSRRVALFPKSLQFPPVAVLRRAQRLGVTVDPESLINRGHHARRSPPSL